MTRKVLPDLIEHSQLRGKLFGDRGYVGKNWKSRYTLQFLFWQL